MKLRAGLLLLFFCWRAPAALTPQAQAYLNQTPDKKLTLPFVIKTALENSEAYQILGLDFATAHLEEQGQVSSLTDTFLTAASTYTDENSVKTNPFQPLRTKQWQWDVGLQKNWSSGTLTKMGWVYDTNETELDSSLGGFSNTFLTQYKQSAFFLNLEQSLLKDGFGYSWRKKLLGARSRAQAIQWKTREDVENVTLNFILEFYNSWLLQQQVASLRSQVDRQTRLVRIMRQRSQKGAVEKPDLIQFEALLSATQSRYELGRASLSNQWEKLVISLKLPNEFLNLDPMEIPTSIDNPVPLSLRICGHKEPTKTAQIHVLEKTLEGLDADYRATKNEALPDLKLVAGYRGNSIENQASTTFENVLRGRDDNGFGLGPTWNVGLRFIMPLENSLAQAQRSQKFIQKEQTSARLRLAVDNVNTQWKDICRRLNVEVENEKNFTQVVSQQKKRLSAEEQRFSLGRIRVNQLVTAEDDLGQWEFSSQQKAIEVRQLAWQVQKLSGELYKNISPLLETLMAKAQE